MRCLSPKRIKNPYTNEYMYVGCRSCDACKVASANNKASLLMQEMSKNWACLYITLTYDNDHLPVVFYGDNKIRRYDKGNLTVIGELDEPCFLEPFEPKNYPFADCTSVIFYRDFQLFIKRLRITLQRNGKGNFKYFVVCEYGTLRKRCHFHAVLFFKSYKEFDGIAEFVCKCWGMCDTAVTRNGIKCADKGASFYLSSYLAGNNDNYRFARERSFRQKCRRSTYYDYGCSTKDKEIVKQAIKEFEKDLRFGRFRSFGEYDLRPFEYVDQTNKDRISVSLVSQRVFATYFRKPYGFSRLPIKSFRVRARIIYKFYHSTVACANQLNPLDKNFYRGYLAYLNLMDYDENKNSYSHYLDIYEMSVISYNSSVNRRFMSLYNGENIRLYFQDCYQTKVIGLTSEFKYKTLLRNYGYSDDEVVPLLSNECLHELKDYVFVYKKRLLPKHQTNIYNIHF